eukprot:TRINITY_DN1180_c0_g1_i2.p2 TRINITY_DN1180_c0_g1~~TRINITY_DN1180_c0_g1_i2.p2  ORF type:complete len:150 (-),score=22.70 TRINITY_DN1180_c0_g1_i2:257-706(-)
MAFTVATPKCTGTRARAAVVPKAISAKAAKGYLVSGVAALLLAATPAFAETQKESLENAATSNEGGPPEVEGLKREIEEATKPVPAEGKDDFSSDARDMGMELFKSLLPGGKKLEKQARRSMRLKTNTDQNVLRRFYWQVAVACQGHCA